MIEESKLENFIRAFSTRCSGCYRMCNCGKEYYDCENDYDWEEGELEGLKDHKKAYPLPYIVGTISFEGKEYVEDCECWKSRAEHLMKFIDGHAYKIADYLTFEKERKQREAEISPVVKEQKGVSYDN